MANHRYVLLTAAKNEEACIAEAVKSVLRQSVPPVAWFIMDDGSTDRTAEIVKGFAAQCPFISLFSTGAAANQRSFGSKDKAINTAYAMAKPLAFDFIGIQDADIAPERSDYYASVLGEFDSHPRLGIAGGYIYERSDGEWRPRKGNSTDSVAGAVQMFRRACFDKIGGYTPLHHGGEDSLAELDARMAGWEVRSLPELHVFHYRPTSSAGGKWRGLFRNGVEDATFGNHPLFELFKCARRLTGSPWVLGSAVRLYGYCWWNLTRRKPVIPPEKVAFLRREQLSRLRSRFWPFGAEPSGELKRS
jgi:biofilm PGA synthesis N-glycosyltransferase PgaC